MTHATRAGRGEGEEERGWAKVWEGAQYRVQQPSLESRKGSGCPVDLGVEHVNCPGGPRTKRFLGCGTSSAKTG